MTRKTGDLSPRSRRLDLTEVVNSRAARERRYRLMSTLAELRPADKVLDVGCGAGRSFETFNLENEIVGLDLDPEQRIFQRNFKFVHGNAAFMDCFKDEEFDVVVCVGVLERVIPFNDLKRAAREIQRVGKAFVVVVPHILTLVDPHSQRPFGQFAPHNLQRFALRWDLIAHPERADSAADTGNEDLFYLRPREWQALFPGAASVSYSYFGLGLLRNLIIYRHRARS